jgi:site-specific recombinase XerD
MDKGYLRRNPARAMERPTVVAMAPTELSEKQRFVLKQLVEQHATHRFAAIFAFGYWAGLRISEIATLRMDQCQVNQRAGSITLVDAKGGKTRTLDLHNLARRALYEVLST